MRATLLEAGGRFSCYTLGLCATLRSDTDGDEEGRPPHLLRSAIECGTQDATFVVIRVDINRGHVAMGWSSCSASAWRNGWVSVPSHSRVQGWPYSAPPSSTPRASCPIVTCACTCRRRCSCLPCVLSTRTWARVCEDARSSASHHVADPEDLAGQSVCTCNCRHCIGRLACRPPRRTTDADGRS